VLESSRFLARDLDEAVWAPPFSGGSTLLRGADCCKSGKVPDDSMTPAIAGGVRERRRNNLRLVGTLYCRTSVNPSLEPRRGDRSLGAWRTSACWWESKLICSTSRRPEAGGGMGTRGTTYLGGGDRSRVVS